jgi:hypothetical protein
LGIGVLVGERNGLTILDIDSNDEQVLERMLDRHGYTPIVVRTASRKFHCWFRHGGEPRVLRLYGDDPPVDLLGANGFAVAPPSRTERGTYEFISGGLHEFGNLPTIKGLRDISSGVTASLKKTVRVTQGQRNETMFAACLRQAASSTSPEALSEFAKKLNASLEPPLPESELLRCAKSAWTYQLRGRNVFAGGITPFERLRRSGSRSAVDAYYLYGLIERANWNRDKFALSKAFAKAIRWGENRYRKARRTLESAGLIRCIHPGGKGPNDPPTYEWGGRDCLSKGL